MWNQEVRVCVCVLWWLFVRIKWLEMGKHLNSLRYLRGIERPGLFQHCSIKDEIQVSNDIYTKKDSLSAHLELSRHQAKGLSCPPTVLTFLGGFEVGVPPRWCDDQFIHPFTQQYIQSPIVWDALGGNDLCPPSLDLSLTQRTLKTNVLVSRQAKTKWIFPHWFPILIHRTYCFCQASLSLWIGKLGSLLTFFCIRFDL